MKAFVSGLNGKISADARRVVRSVLRASWIYSTLFLVACSDDAPETIVACKPDSVQSWDIPPGMINAKETRMHFKKLYNDRFGEKSSEDRKQVLLAVSINAAGRVYDSQIVVSSGSTAHDSIALATARVFEFSPAYKDGKAVCTKVDLPITFPPE